MSVESMYCFVFHLDEQKTTTKLHVLEITKIVNGMKLRLLENTHSVGCWENIETMILQGLDLNTLILGTKKCIVRIDKSEFMEPDMQVIRLFGFPDIEGLD